MSLTSYQTAPPRAIRLQKSEARSQKAMRRSCAWHCEEGCKRVFSVFCLLSSVFCLLFSVFWSPFIEDLAATYSPTPSDAVPSALRVFTAEFGMGSGVLPLAKATRPSMNGARSAHVPFNSCGLGHAGFAGRPAGSQDTPGTPGLCLTDGS